MWHLFHSVIFAPVKLSVQLIYVINIMFFCLVVVRNLRNRNHFGLNFSNRCSYIFRGSILIDFGNFISRYMSGSKRTTQLTRFFMGLRPRPQPTRWSRLFLDPLLQTQKLKPYQKFENQNKGINEVTRTV